MRHLILACEIRSHIPRSTVWVADMPKYNGFQIYVKRPTTVDGRSNTVTSYNFFGNDTRDDAIIKIALATSERRKLEGFYDHED